MKKNCYSVVLFIFVCANLFAQNLGSTFQVTPYFDLHGYTWKEFDDNGSEALKESGPRFSLGVMPRYSFLPKKNLYIEMEMQFTFGTVNYDGFTFDLQTGARTPFTTQTAYSDFGLNANAGYIIEVSRTFQVAPVAGFGYELWKRDIGNGAPNGYDEKYSVVLANVGVNGTFIVSHSAQLFSGFLIRIPLSFTETIDQIPRVNPQKSNITLNPGINPRFLVQVGGSVYRAFAVLYFETWTLSKSPEVQTLHQPESTQTHFGIKLGYTIGVI